MEDHAHAMGHHAMGQMQMDGQPLHAQVLTGYPALGSEVLVATTGGYSHIDITVSCWKSQRMQFHRCIVQVAYACEGMRDATLHDLPMLGKAAAKYCLPCSRQDQIDIALQFNSIQPLPELFQV